MKLLVIGGTKFVGRASIGYAVEQGHEVTIFHRGQTEPEGLPDVEHVHGDRDGGLDALAGRSWDAVLDTSAYHPRAVRELAEALDGSAGHYSLVSTISVYDEIPDGADEDTPIAQPPFPDTEEVTWGTYGPLKAACEAAARETWGERCLILRPGYIVGPYDPTDRFTYWLRRVSTGGQMIAGGPPDMPLQFIDVRDLAAFLIDRSAARDPGLYVAVGPGSATTWGEVLETARQVAGSDASFTWIDQGFADAKLGEGRAMQLPMWDPDEVSAHRMSPARAVAAGLHHRPMAETFAATMEWDAARGTPPLNAGLDPEREQELLRARSAR
jgi:nucleoside-diphosphate-sugar epimerase